MATRRFHGLREERRRHLLGVARMHFARDGVEGASYNRIIADAGISKTSAYLYFDGRDDLVAEVLRDLDARLTATLGEWEPTNSSEDFWAALEAGSARLQAHLHAHPHDLALVVARPEWPAHESFDAAWFGALLRDGQGHGVVRRDVSVPLMLAATRALFRVFDVDALTRLTRGERPDTEPAFRLLRSLWCAERRDG